MSPVQRAAAFVVAFLVLVAVLVVVLSGADGPLGRRPSASASAPPSGTASPGPTATANASPSPTGTTAASDVLAVLAEIEEQVLAIRGLPAPDIGPAEILTRDELAVELEELFEAKYPPEDRERDNFVVRAFGLLGPDEDIGDLQLELLTDQVAGFYNSEDKRMVVVSDTGLDAEAKLTYAHEYTHALQDAAFGLDSLDTDAAGEDDRGLARLALQEGDATLTMLAWALQHLTQEELMEIGGTPVPDTSNVPSWMLNQLIFPYITGQEFVMAIMGSGANPLAPDFTEVDAAFGAPPTSTAQVIEPRKYLDGVEPIEVDLPDLASALGDGWEEVDASSVGQATTRIVLEHFGVGLAATDAADGWAGDRAVVVRGPDDEFALAWRLAFESEDDAAEFETAYQAVIDALAFPALATRDGSLVLVAHASDTDLLRRSVDAAR